MGLFSDIISRFRWCSFINLTDKWSVCITNRIVGVGTAKIAVAVPTKDVSSRADRIGANEYSSQVKNNTNLMKHIYKHFCSQSARVFPQILDIVL